MAHKTNHGYCQFARPRDLLAYGTELRAVTDILRLIFRHCLNVLLSQLRYLGKLADFHLVIQIYFRASSTFLRLLQPGHDNTKVRLPFVSGLAPHKREFR